MRLNLKPTSNNIVAVYLNNLKKTPSKSLSVIDVEDHFR